MTLRVGPTSLDRVDGERLQHRVSSLPLLSVEKVYLFTDDATQVCAFVRCAHKALPAAFLCGRGSASTSIDGIYLGGWFCVLAAS